MKVQNVPRCAHDLPNGFAFGIAAVAAGQCLEVTENGMTTKYQPNAANQYAKIAHGTKVVEPEDDPQGNGPSLRSRPAKWRRFEDTAIAVKQWPHDATRKYTWDADIHLISVTTQGGATVSVAPEKNGQAGAEAQRRPAEPTLPHLSPHNDLDEAPSKTTTTRFVYDALHRRLGRIKDNGETTVFVYEGWNVIAEKTVNLTLSGVGDNFKLETRYTWGEDLSGSLQGAGGIGGLLRSVNSTENRELRTENTFHYDSNGNVILLTDTQGRESARYAYDAFGKTLTATGPAARGNRYRFSTKPVEEESGLVYYGYRYYDPITGRWPSRDPIGEDGGFFLYQMAENNALSKLDYLGMSVPATPVPGTPIVMLGLQIAFGQGMDICEAQANSFVGPMSCRGCCQIGIILTNQQGALYYISTFSHAIWTELDCDEMKAQYLNTPQINPLNLTVYWLGI